MWYRTAPFTTRATSTVTGITQRPPVPSVPACRTPLQRSPNTCPPLAQGRRRQGVRGWRRARPVTRNNSRASRRPAAPRDPSTQPRRPCVSATTAPWPLTRCGTGPHPHPPQPVEPPLPASRIDADHARSQVSYPLPAMQRRSRNAHPLPARRANLRVRYRTTPIAHGRPLTGHLPAVRIDVNDTRSRSCIGEAAVSLRHRPASVTGCGTGPHPAPLNPLTGLRRRSGLIWTTCVRGRHCSFRQCRNEAAMLLRHGPAESDRQVWYGTTPSARQKLLTSLQVTQPVGADDSYSRECIRGFH